MQRKPIIISPSEIKFIIENKGLPPEYQTGRSPSPPEFNPNQSPPPPYAGDDQSLVATLSPPPPYPEKKNPLTQWFHHLFQKPVVNNPPLPQPQQAPEQKPPHQGPQQQGLNPLFQPRQQRQVFDPAQPLQRQQQVFNPLHQRQGFDPTQPLQRQRQNQPGR